MFLCLTVRAEYDPQLYAKRVFLTGLVDVIEPSAVTTDGLPHYLSLNYGNGPGYTAPRRNKTEVDYKGKNQKLVFGHWPLCIAHFKCHGLQENYVTLGQTLH